MAFFLLEPLLGKHAYRPGAGNITWLCLPYGAETWFSEALPASASARPCHHPALAVAVPHLQLLLARGGVCGTSSPLLVSFLSAAASSAVRSWSASSSFAPAPSSAVLSPLWGASSSFAGLSPSRVALDSAVQETQGCFPQLVQCAVLYSPVVQGASFSVRLDSVLLTAILWTLLCPPAVHFERGKHGFSWEKLFSSSAIGENFPANSSSPTASSVAPALLFS